MKIGVNFWIWDSPFKIGRDLPLIEQARTMGAEVVEFASAIEPRHDARLVRRALQDNGLAATMIGLLGPEQEPSSPDPAARRTSMEEFKRHVDLCLEVGATLLTTTINFVPGKVLLEGEARRERLAQAADTYRQVGELAQRAGLRYTHEVLNRYETNFINTAQEAIELMEMVNHPAVGVHLDCFHMGLEEKSVGAAIRTAGDKLFHFHASASDRSVPGGDLVDWDDVAQALREIGYQGSAVIESFNRHSWLGPHAYFWREHFADPAEAAKRGIAFLKKALRRETD
jgi:D-psicose/D-tagatose/L-ribulose 3-epimerase